MDMLELMRPQRSHPQRRRATRTPHEFLTHDQRNGGVQELEFDDLDDRERTIFLRCGFHAPHTAQAR